VTSRDKLQYIFHFQDFVDYSDKNDIIQNYIWVSMLIKLFESSDERKKF
jgi:hypothetical protein